MARDCPDRQRGADWRNGPPAPGGPGSTAGRPAAGRIGAGDAVDREYEVCFTSICGMLIIANISPATYAGTFWRRSTTNLRRSSSH